MTNPICDPPRYPAVADLWRSGGYVPGPTWWWLSFAGPGGCRGVSIVPVPPGGGISEAVDMAWNCGCNPGGQVAGDAMSPEAAQRYLSMLTPATLHSPEAIHAANERIDKEGWA